MTPIRFIIIDDDEINNKICTMAIDKMATGSYVQTFRDPFEGFNRIVSEYSNPNEDFTAVLFLDISMPGMDAWEFLDRFDKLDASIKNRMEIYVLSSSDDKRDMNRALENKNVVDYLVKPVIRETIRLVVHAHNKRHIH